MNETPQLNEHNKAEHPPMQKGYFDISTTKNHATMHR